MKAWTKEDFDKFKVEVCDDKNLAECSGCDRSNKIILQCFDDLIAE